MRQLMIRSIPVTLLPHSYKSPSLTRCFQKDSSLKHLKQSRDKLIKLSQHLRSQLISAEGQHFRTKMKNQKKIKAMIQQNLRQRDLKEPNKTMMLSECLKDLKNPLVLTTMLPKTRNLSNNLRQLKCKDRIINQECISKH